LLAELLGFGAEVGVIGSNSQKGASDPRTDSTFFLGYLPRVCPNFPCSAKNFFKYFLGLIYFNF
jgi:hypothetical protein